MYMYDIYSSLHASNIYDKLVYIFSRSIACLFCLIAPTPGIEPGVRMRCVKVCSSLVLKV